MLGRDVTPENAGYVDFDFPTSEFNDIHETIINRVNKPPAPLGSCAIQYLGAVTVCVVQLRTLNTRKIIGVSRCSAQDTYNRDIGRKLAISRAVRKAYEIEAHSS